MLVLLFTFRVPAWRMFAVTFRAESLYVSGFAAQQRLLRHMWRARTLSVLRWVSSLFSLLLSRPAAGARRDPGICVVLQHMRVRAGMQMPNGCRNCLLTLFLPCRGCLSSQRAYSARSYLKSSVTILPSSNCQRTSRLGSKAVSVSSNASAVSSRVCAQSGKNSR